MRMSSSSRSSVASSRCECDREISELIFKLQALLPEQNRRHLRRVSKDEVLKEVCNYLKTLTKEADNLSERLSQLLASTVDADALTTLSNSLFGMSEPQAHKGSKSIG